MTFSTKADQAIESPAKRRAFTIDEFCDRYPIRKTKLYEEIKAGRLQARKIGKRTIITADDAEAWLNRLPRMGASCAAPPKKRSP